MFKQRFSYLAVEIESSPAFPNGYTARRPIAHVSIGRGDKATKEFIAVVDTGADYCMFPSDYLNTLGIDRDSLPTGPVHGVGKDEGIRFATVNLKVGHLGEWPVYAGFSDHWSGQHVGFLGHIGFLERFAVFLDCPNQTLEIRDKTDG